MRLNYVPRNLLVVAVEDCIIVMKGLGGDKLGGGGCAL